MSVSAQVSNKIIRLSAVIAITGLSRSAIYAGMNNGTFPKSIKLGLRSMGFVQAEIDAWIDSRIAIRAA